MSEKDYVLEALAAIGGTGTSYAVARQALGRVRSDPENGKDWEFLNVQDDVRTRLRRLMYKGHVTRERQYCPAPSYVWTLSIDAAAKGAEGAK